MVAKIVNCLREVAVLVITDILLYDIGCVACYRAQDPLLSCLWVFIAAEAPSLLRAFCPYCVMM